MNLVLFAFLKCCISNTQHLPPNYGFNSIKLKPKETIEFNNIKPQSFFLFTNPDPRIFKVVVRSNSDYMSEPFADNGPVLDLIKSKIDKTQPSKNAILLVDNFNNTPLNNNMNDNNNKVITNSINYNSMNSNPNRSEKRDNDIQNNMPTNNNENNNNHKGQVNNLNHNNHNNFNSNQMNNQNDQINNQNNQINNQNSQINNQNNQMNNQNNQIHDQNNQIHDQNNQINNQIHDQNNQIRDQNNQIRDQNNQIRDQNNQIHDQNNQINNHINNHINNQNNHNNQINNQNNQIKNQNDQINNHNNQINNEINKNEINHPNNENRDNTNNQNNTISNNEIVKKPHKITEKDLVFGIFVGSKGYRIIITALESFEQTVSIDFYHLSQKEKAHQIYLSTYPNDIFGIGNSPEGFDVCKPFVDKLISYWNIPGETVYYETSSLNQSKTGKINIMNDNQNYITYPATKSISKTKVNGNFLYFDWMTNIFNKQSFYKVLVRNEINANNYIDKYKSEGIERYSLALNNNILTILPPTRYQFIRPMHVSYINAKHRYGQFARKKDTIPLTSLYDESSVWRFSKTAIIIVVIMLILILIIFSVIDKIQSISYSTGFGEGSKRKVKHRKRKDHKNIKDPQNNNNFGLEYYVEGDGKEKDLDEEEDDGVDDGNLSITKKKKRSPEMNGIMEKILENKK